jgi:hypothetical protein
MTAVIVGSCVLVAMLLAFLFFISSERAVTLHWRHTWSKWEMFEQPVILFKFTDASQKVTGVDRMQRRHCEVCNFTQERVI